MCERLRLTKICHSSSLQRTSVIVMQWFPRSCPVHGFLPLATEEKNIQGIALRRLRDFNEDELKAMKTDLIEITEDGEISPEEVPKLRAILDKLERMAEVISEMKIAGEKFIREA